jgi:hypothetical protein
MRAIQDGWNSFFPKQITGHLADNIVAIGFEYNYQLAGY